MHVSWTLLGRIRRLASRRSWTEPVVDVIVPVLWRPHKPLPFTTSLWDSLTNPAVVQLTVVADPSDCQTMAAWCNRLRPQDQVLLTPTPPGTFARKVNHAYRNTSAAWLLLVGDDVEFHPGWLDAALKVADDDHALVVGTNEQGPDRQGFVAPHLLVSRQYVDDQGASWDGPGIVCHEGYWHNGVDHEIALVARDRGVWGYAANAVIEHHHCWWTEAPSDATYRRGATRAGEDMELLRQRGRDHTPHLPIDMPSFETP